jgi:transposase
VLRSAFTSTEPQEKGDDGGVEQSRRQATPRRGRAPSEIHALVDAEATRCPLLTGGQVASRVEADALTSIFGEGVILLADKRCETTAIRARAMARKARANIPPKADREGHFAFSRGVHRRRNFVERFFDRIKRFRGIATRRDTDLENFLAAFTGRGKAPRQELMGRQPIRIREIIEQSERP